MRIQHEGIHHLSMPHLPKYRQPCPFPSLSFDTWLLDTLQLMVFFPPLEAANSLNVTWYFKNCWRICLLLNLYLMCVLGYAFISHVFIINANVSKPYIWTITFSSISSYLYIFQTIIYLIVKHFCCVVPKYNLLMPFLCFRSLQFDTFGGCSFFLWTCYLSWLRLFHMEAIVVRNFLLTGRELVWHHPVI